jgi:hypothetical protein
MSDEARSEAVLPLDWLITPAAAFNHPDVLSHPGLTSAEKRAILASWASDARAVENSPWLRQLGCGARISLSEVQGALRSLDAEEQSANPRAGSHSRRVQRINGGGAGTPRVGPCATSMRPVDCGLPTAC